MPESQLTRYRNIDENLSVHDWPTSVGQPVRGMVVLVHGLGEHIGRYLEMANRLNEWGFSVRGYDQYGHGESSGARGDLPEPDRLVTDLVAVIDETRTHMDDRLPLILLGHSLGGLVAARLVAQKLRRVEGLVLSSPAFQPRLSLVQRTLLHTLHRVAPHARTASGIDPAALSHDHTVVDAYRNDPLVHDRISARLARFVVTVGPAVLARAPRWKVPTLLLYAGQDRIVHPAGSEAFARGAPSDVVTAKGFPMHFHELFHERERAPVYTALMAWLCQRFPPISLGSAAAPNPEFMESDRVPAPAR
jgi:alpha-beta hydrolase superfamily lysophospholipase